MGIYPRRAAVMELSPNLPRIWLIQTLVEGIDENLTLLTKLIPPSKEVVNTSKLDSIGNEHEIQEEYVKLMRHRSHNQSISKKKAERQRLNAILATLHSVDKKLNEDCTEDKKYLRKLSRKTRIERIRVQDVIRQTITDLETQEENLKIASENLNHKEIEKLYEKT